MIAEYSDPRVKENPSKRIVIAESKTVQGNKIQLIHRLSGWSCAGSVARFDNEAFGAIVYYSNGTTSGQWTCCEEDARRLFDMWSA